MHIRIAADALGIKTKLVSIIAKCFLRGSIQRVQDSHDTNKFFTDVVVKGKAKHTARFSAKVREIFPSFGQTCSYLLLTDARLQEMDTYLVKIHETSNVALPLLYLISLYLTFKPLLF
mgnify:CR=1 FL=1